MSPKDWITKVRQRLAPILMALAIILGTVTAVTVTNAGPAHATTNCGDVLVKASDWLGGSGVDVHSNGSYMETGTACANNNVEVYDLNANPPQYGYGWQCVELIERLYVSKGWSSTMYLTGGMAKSLYTDAANGKFGAGIVAYANGSKYTPVAGDVIVHSNGTYGHVSVVDHISGVTLYAVDQNRSYTGWESYTYDSTTGTVSLTGATISGFVHATGNTNSSGGSGTPPPPPSTPFAPAMVQRPSGETDVAAVSASNELDFYTNAQGSSSWGKLTVAPANSAYSAYSAPAMLQRPSGETDIAVQGPGNSLVFYWNAQGSSSWGSVTVPRSVGATYSAPAMVVRPSGEIDIAAQGAGNSMNFWFNAQGSPNNWGESTVSTPNTAYSAPAMIQRTSGETDITMQGAGNSLAFCFNLPGQPNWGYLTVSGSSGSTYGSPVVLQRSSGETDIAVQGAGNSLDFYYNAQGDPNWGESTVTTPNTAYSAPAMVQRPSGETDIVLQGSSNSLGFTINTQGQPNWGYLTVTSSAGSADSAPAMVQRPSGETDIVVEDTNHNLHYFCNAQGDPNWGEMTFS